MLLNAKFREPGNLSPRELQAISQKSCGVLRNMGPQVAVGAKLRDGQQDLLHLHCAHAEHARQGGFPAHSISEIKTMIDSTTAE